MYSLFFIFQSVIEISYFFLTFWELSNIDIIFTFLNIDLQTLVMVYFIETHFLESLPPRWLSGRCSCFVAKKTSSIPASIELTQVIVIKFLPMQFCIENLGANRLCQLVTSTRYYIEDDKILIFK